MFSAALLGIIQEAGSAIMILAEAGTEEEMLRSRLTRTEIVRQLAIIAQTLANVPEAVRAKIPEVAWDQWQRLPTQLGASGEAPDEALKFACSSMVPATLLWLRHYQQSQPELFSYVAS